MNKVILLGYKFSLYWYAFLYPIKITSEKRTYNHLLETSNEVIIVGFSFLELLWHLYLSS